MLVENLDFRRIAREEGPHPEAYLRRARMGVSRRPALPRVPTHLVLPDCATSTPTLTHPPLNKSTPTPAPPADRCGRATATYCRSTATRSVALLWWRSTCQSRPSRQEEWRRGGGWGWGANRCAPAPTNRCCPFLHTPLSVAALHPGFHPGAEAPQAHRQAAAHGARARGWVLAASGVERRLVCAGHAGTLLVDPPISPPPPHAYPPAHPPTHAPTHTSPHQRWRRGRLSSRRRARAQPQQQPTATSPPRPPLALLLRRRLQRWRMTPRLERRSW